MSRVGKKVIKIPAGVTVTTSENKVVVKGPKGELSYDVRPEISIAINDGEVNFKVVRETKESSAYWGLARALVANMITGVSEGFEKKLELVGVGYRVKSDNPKRISLAVGYSHPVVYEAPDNIQFEVADDKAITIRGIDKHVVGQVAAEIRKVRKPEPYKGKGIKYIDEVVRRKAGKTGKTGK